MKPDQSKGTFWSEAPEEFKLQWRTAMAKVWIGIGSDIEQLIFFENMIGQWSDSYLLAQKEAASNRLITSLKDDEDKELEQLKHLAFLFIMGDKLRSRKDG